MAGCCAASPSDQRKMVTKWDSADNADIESVKGGLSDAMKRAAVSGESADTSTADIFAQIDETDHTRACIRERQRPEGPAESGFSVEPHQLPDCLPQTRSSQGRAGTGGGKVRSKSGEEIPSTVEWIAPPVKDAGVNPWIFSEVEDLFTPGAPALMQMPVVQERQRKLAPEKQHPF